MSNQWHTSSTSPCKAPAGGDYPYFPVKQASFGLWISILLADFVLILFMFYGPFTWISSKLMAAAQAYSNGDAGMASGMVVFILLYGQAVIISLLVLISLAVAAVFFCIILHRAWQCLRAGSPRTTPEKAVYFLFIPLFNIYWMFVAFAGLPKEWNRIIASHPDLHAAPNLNGTMFLLFCIGCLVFPPLAIIVMFPMVFQMCKGINFSATRHNPNAAGAFNAPGARQPTCKIS